MLKRIVRLNLIVTCLLISVVNAETEWLVEGKEINISKQQFISALNRMDGATRNKFLSDENRVFKAVKNFYINKVAVERAKKTGAYNSAKMQALIEKAIDDVVIKELFTQFQTEKLAEKNFEKLASDYYRANVEQYKIPDEISAAHILILTKDTSKTDAKKRIDELRARIVNGESFETLALEFSEDPSVKNNSGSLGYFSREKMVKSFSDAAFQLENIGDISPVVETKFGYHIIKLEGKKETAYQTFDQIKSTLIEKLKETERNRLIQLYRNDLLGNEDLKVNTEAIKSMVTK